jgi:hypothetical protein
LPKDFYIVGNRDGVVVAKRSNSVFLRTNDFDLKYIVVKKRQIIHNLSSTCVIRIQGRRDLLCMYAAATRVDCEHIRCWRSAYRRDIRHDDIALVTVQQPRCCQLERRRHTHAHTRQLSDYINPHLLCQRYVVSRAWLLNNNKEATTRSALSQNKRTKPIS